MRGGNLRGLLTIQRAMTVGSKNPSFYEPNQVWANWREDIPCEIEVRRGREHFAVLSGGKGQRYSEDVWLFRVRYDEVSGLSTKDRILHDDLVFDIKSRRPDAQKRRDVIIECTVQDAVQSPAALSVSIEEVIPEGVVAEPYGGFTVLASGGTAPYVFAAESAGLPPGLSINAGTGAVSGTPTDAGAFACQIEVSDAAGDSIALPDFSITISAS